MASGVNVDRDALGGEERGVLLDQRAFGLRQDPDELVTAQRLELDPNRKPSLQLGNQVRRLRHVERAGRNEQDVIGAHHAVLRVHGRAFDDRQNVALHAFAADVRALRAFAPGDLVDLVDEDDARLLDAIDGANARRRPCR